MHQPHRHYTICIIVLIVASLCACSNNNAPQLPELTSTATVLAFGDSLTYGTGADRDESYPAVLSQLSGHTVINAGIPGEISAQGRERLPALLDKHRPELLLLTHGGNDMLRRFNADITRNNIESMIIAAQQRNIPVILVGIPKLGLMFLDTAEIYDEIAEKYGLVYEDSIFAEVESDNALKSDQIHPNAKGYRRIAEAMYKLLTEHGALPSS